MLPDFPDIKNELQQISTEFMRSHVREDDPVLSMIKSSYQHEGKRRSYTTVEGSQRSVDYQTFEALIEIPKSELKSMTIREIFGKLQACRWSSSCPRHLRQPSE